MKKKRTMLRFPRGGMAKILLRMNLLTVLMLTVVTVSAANDSYSQVTKFNLKLKDVTVRQVFFEIEENSEFIFLYNEKSLDVNQEVDVKVKNETVESVLDQVFEGTLLTYKIYDRQIVILKNENAEIPIILRAKVEVEQEQQQKEITGTVTDDEGLPLPGVSVVVKGTTIGTVTNTDGNFSLSIPANAEILQFSFVGMKIQEVAVEDRTTFMVVMEEEIMGMEEIVVVGYGVQRKSDITGSVISLPEERLQKLPNNNFAQAIQGIMPGVSVTNTSAGAEGGGEVIIVRGRNSITADNTPLIILDGIPFSGSYSEINPMDIASLEILKDASAAAIYGSRGSNGVILITSKKGKAGETRITYNGFMGASQIANIPGMLNGPEFYAFKNKREPDELTPSEIEIYNSGEWVDWVEEATRMGQKHQHTLSASGGSEKTRFYISGTYLNVKGIAKNDDFSRYSTFVNIDSDLTSWLTFGSNTKLSLIDRAGLPADFGDAFLFNPLTSAYDENGDLTIYPWEDDHYFDNPLQHTIAKNKDKSYSLFTNNYIEVKIPFIEDLKYKLNIGYELNTRRDAAYYGRDTYDGFVVGGSASSRNTNRSNLVVENILSYEKLIGKNKLFLTGLYSFQENEFERERLISEGFSQDVLTWYQPDVATSLVPSVNYSKEDILSMMFRTNYSYDDKYLLTFTVRRDGYSGFGRDSKWGIFPSFGLGWNITNENFLQGFGDKNHLKFRLSYGKNGNQAVGPYETMATLQNDSYVLGSTSVAGFYPSTLGINNLGWESTTSLNFGLDLLLFNNRIQGTLDHYISNTTDLLLNRTISSVHGITSIIQNIGEVKNTGTELMVTSHNLSETNFKWSTTITTTYMKNEIIDLYGDGSDDLANKWFIGKPITSNYELAFDGVFQLDDDIANSAQPSAEPGFAKINDVDNNKVINDDDRQIIGHIDPDFIWGMTNNFEYKNFSLNIFFQGVNGGTRSNELLLDDVWPGTRRKPMKNNWWTPENPTNEHWANHKNANMTYEVNRFEKTDYIRLKDITLTYNFPSSVLQILGFSNFQFYLSGRNLMTITDWSGLDPEFTIQRSIPLQKEYTAGIVLGF